MMCVPRTAMPSGLTVEAVGVRAEDGPVDAALAALEDGAALVDEEVVADVVPAVDLGVVRVDAAHDRRGLRAVVVVGAVGVVHEHRLHVGVVLEGRGSSTRPRPSRTRGDGRLRHRGRRRGGLDDGDGDAVGSDDGDGDAVGSDDSDGDAVGSDDGDGDAVGSDDGDGDGDGDSSMTNAEARARRRGSRPRSPRRGRPGSPRGPWAARRWCRPRGRRGPPRRRRVRPTAAGTRRACRPRPPPAGPRSAPVTARRPIHPTPGRGCAPVRCPPAASAPRSRRRRPGRTARSPCGAACARPAAVPFSSRP